MRKTVTIYNVSLFIIIIGLTIYGFSTNELFIPESNYNVFLRCVISFGLGIGIILMSWAIITERREKEEEDKKKSGLHSINNKPMKKSKDIEEVLSERRGSVIMHILGCSILMGAFLWKYEPIFNSASFFEQIMLSLGGGTTFFFLYWGVGYIIFRRADIYPLCIVVESFIIMIHFGISYIWALF